MSKPRQAIMAALACLLALGTSFTATAQNLATSAPVHVDRNTGSIELITKTSRLIQFDYAIPELVIDNQSIIRATPIAADKVLLTALKPGFATITVSDAQQNTQTLSVQVRGDVRALESALNGLYPNSTLRATALETGVVLSGTLARGDDVDGAVLIAGEFFPTVYNNIKLPDAQMIAIEVQVYEVARTKVRELGLDWQLFTDDLTLDVSGAANATSNLLFSVVDDDSTFNGFLQALERRSLARLLDKPILVTMNGRPAEFLQGGEIPFEINQGLGNTTIQFRPFGTKLDVVPIVQREGTVRLEVRAEVSEPDATLAGSSGVSGFRVRRVNTGVDMKIGHTLALAGDIREEIESEVTGIPKLMDLPLIGRGFSRVSETTQEIELVMLLTPRFISEVDPSVVPAAPGRTTVSPSDGQLYRDGYLEVPRCEQDCPLPGQPVDPIPGHQYGGGFTQQPGAPAFAPHQGTYQSPSQPSNFQYPNPNPPTQVPAAGAGFGYPGQGAPATQPRTGNRSWLDKLRR